MGKVLAIEMSATSTGTREERMVVGWSKGVRVGVRKDKYTQRVDMLC